MTASPEEPFAIALPGDVSQVDAAWLQRALRLERPDLTVMSANIVASLGGACTKLRMAIETSDPDFPASVVVKGCFEPHTMSMVPSQFVEAAIYRHAVPHLPDLETVRCFFVQADREMGSALVMEDLALRDAVSLEAQHPITDFAVASDFLDNLAKIHARWWNSPELGDDGPFGFTRGLGQLSIPFYHQAYGSAEEFARILRQPRGAAVSRRLHDGPRLLEAFDRLAQNPLGQPIVLAHGDPHLANLYLTGEGKAGLLDWTSIRVPWAQDVSYFIAGCLDMEDRREWEKPLLQYYLGRLAAHGVDAPGWEEAWRAYRCWLLWGLYVWLVNLPEYHSEENITAMAVRFGDAVMQHDTMSLIGA